MIETKQFAVVVVLAEEKNPFQVSLDECLCVPSSPAAVKHDE